jgi:hypothetical protein
MAIVQRLSQILPDEFTAEPHVHLGAYFEIDVCAYEDEEAETAGADFPPNFGGRGGSHMGAARTDARSRH